MNRIGGALLATAAVIGIVAGGYAGVMIGRPGDGSQTEDPPASKQPDSPVDHQLLFYATPEEIHDTGVIVRLTGLAADRADRIVALERLPGGDAWLLVLSTSDSLGTYEAQRVNQDGTVRSLGDFAGVWDLSKSADRLIAMTTDSSAYVVRSTQDGSELDRIAPADVEETEAAEAAGVAAFSATGVVTAWTPFGTGRSKLYETKLGSRLTDVVGTDFYDWSASPGGLLLAGEKAEVPDDPDGARCLEGGPVGKSTGWWKNCDWGAGSRFGPRYSPDGERLLAVPTDSGSATTFAIVDAEDQAAPIEFEIEGDPRAAQWYDDHSFFVLSGTEEGPSLISLCVDSSSTCAEVTRIDNRVVLGTP